MTAQLARAAREVIGSQKLMLGNPYVFLSSLKSGAPLCDIERSGADDARALRWDGTTVLIEDGTVISVHKDRDVAPIRRKAKNDLKKQGWLRDAA
jgi:hypothetical protein